LLTLQSSASFLIGELLDRPCPTMAVPALLMANAEVGVSPALVRGSVCLFVPSELTRYPSFAPELVGLVDVPTTSPVFEAAFPTLENGEPPRLPRGVIVCVL